MTKQARSMGFSRGVKEVVKNRQYEVKIQWREGGRRRCHSEQVYGTYTEARKRHTELVHQRDQGRRLKAKNLTVNEYLDLHLANSPNRKTTLASKRMAFRCYVRPRLGTLRIGDVTALNVKGLYADMRTGTLTGKPLSDATISMTHRYLRRAFNEAVADDILVSNPLASIKLGKKGCRAELQPLSERELEEFVRAAQNSVWSLLFITMAFTGLRRGEAVGLKWNDIDFDKKLLTVRRSVCKLKKTWHVNKPKNGVERTITLPPFLVQLLAQEFDGDQEGWVFGNGKGQPGDLRSIDRAFKTVLKNAGLPDIRLHDLRHTHATQLIKSNQPIKAVSERLGHGGVEITIRQYFHTDARMQEKIALDLESRFALAAGTLQPPERRERTKQGTPEFPRTSRVGYV